MEGVIRQIGPTQVRRRPSQFHTCEYNVGHQKALGIQPEQHGPNWCQFKMGDEVAFALHGLNIDRKPRRLLAESISGFRRIDRSRKTHAIAAS